jgi:fatty acid desaturase
MSTWTLYGVPYSLEAFKLHHPGGTLALTLGEGSDCTLLFEQYHARPAAALRALRGYSVPGAPSPQPSSDAFHADLLAEVNALPSAKASALTLALTAVGAAGLAALYALWAAGSTPALLLLPFFHWPLAGAAHDASHFALSSQPWVNELFGLLAAPLYFNSGQWAHQHNVAHHVHTNEVGKDHDLHHFGHHARLHPGIPWQPSHASQLLFTAVAFPLATLAQTLLFPGRLLLGLGFFNQPQQLPGSPSTHPITRRTLLATALQWLASVAFLAYPALRWGPSLGSFAWAAYPYAMAGLIFMFITQVSHVQHSAQQAQGLALAGGQVHWSRVQVASSMDYAQDCPWTAFFTAGLNMQALHHVVPGCHSSRLRELYPRFRAVCKKHGVAINEVPGFAAAVASYFQHLGMLSRLPSAAAHLE